MQTETIKYSFFVDEISRVIIGLNVNLEKPSWKGAALALNKAISVKD